MPASTIAAGTTGPYVLFFGEMLVGQVEFACATPTVTGAEGGALEFGRDGGAPVTRECKPPSEFTGTIDSVTVDVSGELARHTKAEIRQIMPH